MKKSNTSSQTPIHFIIGPGRCGTTLLMMLFNNNENIISSPELKHIVYFYEKYHQCESFNTNVKDEFVKYFKELKNASLNPLIKYKEENIQEISSAKTYAEFCIKVHQALHNNFSAHTIIDKNPYYSFYFDLLHNLFPEAKFLFLVRDYRGFINSHLNSTHQFQKKRSTTFYAVIWNEYVSRYFKIKKQYPESIMLIKMEELVSHPEKVYQQICAYLSIDYNSEVFHYKEKLSKELNDFEKYKTTHPRIYKKMTDLIKPITNEHVHNWKTSMSKNKIAKSDVICSNMGENLGYKAISNYSMPFALWTKTTALPRLLLAKIYFKFMNIRLYHSIKIKRQINFKINRN